MRAAALEKAFAVLTLFLFSDALVIHLRRQAGFQVEEASGDPVLQVVWLIIYLITFGLVATRLREFLGALTADRWLLALTVFALATIVWSPEPAVTLRRSVGLLGTFLFGLYLASRYEFTEWLEIVGTALAVVAFTSLLFVVFLPTYGVHQQDLHAGLWRGVFTGKNHLGRVMALSITTSAVLMFRGRHAVWWLIVLAVSVLLLIQAGSRTALVGLLSVVLLAPATLLVRLHPSLLYPSASVAVVGAGAFGWWVLTHLDTITSALGRDPTLSGRMALWLAVADRIRDRLFGGYGFGTFWIGTGETSAPVWRITEALNSWQPVSAHNGLLDLLLAVGIIGAGLFAATVAATIARSMRWQRASRWAIGTWPMAFLMLLLVANLGESSLFRQNNVYWSLYVALAATLARWSRAHGGQAAIGQPSEANQEGISHSEAVPAPARPSGVSGQDDP